MFYFKLNDDAELRLLERRHAKNLFLLTDKSRDHLKEWLPWVDYIKEISNSEDFIVGALKQFSVNDGFQAGIWYKGELAGVIGLHGINWAHKSTSIGYWIGEEFQGNGLMTSACKSIIDYCFNELNIKRIEIRTATENQKSQAIPQKLGFKNEGLIRSSELLYDRYVDHYVYGLLNEDYNGLI